MTFLTLGWARLFPTGCMTWESKLPGCWWDPMLTPQRLRSRLCVAGGTASVLLGTQTPPLCWCVQMPAGQNSAEYVN